ncbi:hypothetical protein KR018_008988, partial [Drosophila ironensis]
MDRLGIIIGVCCLLFIGWGQCYPQIGIDDTLLNPLFGLQRPQFPPAREESSTTTTTTTARPTAPSRRYLACLQTCPTTSEYNPICGSDRVVYYNENKFNCAVSCGQSECPSFRLDL